jgi:hypothetical protein
VEEKDVSLEMLEQLPPYEDLKELETRLRSEGALTFDRIFHQPTGYYMMKCFLVADYAVDKAIFIKDVEAYKSMRFESARRKIAKLLYQRFVACESDHDLVFDKVLPSAVCCLPSAVYCLLSTVCYLLSVILAFRCLRD